MIYEEDTINLKHYLSEYTKRFDIEDIAVFIYSHLGHTDMDSALKKSMRKFDVLLEEVSPIIKQYFTEKKGEPKRYVGIKDLKTFIGLSALEFGVRDLLKDGYDVLTVAKIVATYLKSGNFNVIPDDKIKESFSNVGVQIMKEAMLLEGCYRVSEYVTKINEQLNKENKEENIQK